MSVQVAVAAPAVELKELGGPMDKAAGPPCEPVGAHSAGHGAAAAPACPVPGAEREAAPAPSAERPPGSGCPGLSSAAGLSSTAGLSSAAAKVPQASAMKRSDPHHPQHRHRDGSDGGGAAAEALVSPDGSVTEAPRTVKKDGLRKREFVVGKRDFCRGRWDFVVGMDFFFAVGDGIPSWKMEVPPGKWIFDMRNGIFAVEDGISAWKTGFQCGKWNFSVENGNLS
ncbi:hypothetical protein DUI87_33329 [Hirundo rustica rustica]|uniref:Uncharacterized protein n=1 Tax=Hirundo rustica rustica TaxID=333673 RepID=A0A3M0J6T3_HIRRU|nr:hypothetical protein DUI87_33329 [Hirundo rustica rustica]